MIKTIRSKKAWTWIPLIFVVLLTATSACSNSHQTESAEEKSAKAKSTETGGVEEKTAEDSRASSSRNVANTADEFAPPKTDRPYLNRLLPEAQRIHQEFGIPVDTTLAIAIHETGWGKYEIGQNNHFGLRCASEDCTTLSKNGRGIRYETCPDESECFDMFAKSLVELSNGQPNDLRVIYKNGYATSPSWVRKVRRIRRQVRKTLQEAGVELER